MNEFWELERNLWLDLRPTVRTRTQMPPITPPVAKPSKRATARYLSASNGTWTEEDVQALPPLPMPDHAGKCGEATCGCTLVLVLIGMLVATTEGVVSAIGAESYTARLGRIAIWTEAVVALLCLAGLMFGVRGQPQPSLTPLPNADRHW